MNYKNYILPAILVTIIGVIGLILVIGFSVLGIYNDEASLKNRYDMKLVDDHNQFDNMWKQIAQSTQIADKNKDAFKEIFSEWAKGNTPQDGGKMMLWIKQTAPNLSDVSSTYKQVMNIMTGQRDGFAMRQTELISIAEVYNNNLVQQPRGFILSIFGFKHIDPLIVTSQRTDDAFKTGQDNDINLTPTK